MRRLIATAVASSKIAVIFFPFAQTQERGSLRREGPAPRKNPVLGISQSTLMPCVPRSAGGIGRPSQHAPGALPQSRADERRVGNECVRKCKARGSPTSKKKKKR